MPSPRLATQNGHSKAHAEDESQFSPAYYALKASIDAHEMLESMTTPERLEMIETQLPPVEWYKPEHLSIIATVRHNPPGKWEQTKQIFKDALIGFRGRDI